MACLASAWTLLLVEAVEWGLSVLMSSAWACCTNKCIMWPSFPQDLLAIHFPVNALLNHFSAHDSSQAHFPFVELVASSSYLVPATGLPPTSLGLGSHGARPHSFVWGTSGSLQKPGACPYLSIWCTSPLQRGVAQMYQEMWGRGLQKWACERKCDFCFWLWEPGCDETLASVPPNSLKFLCTGPLFPHCFYLNKKATSIPAQMKAINLPKTDSTTILTISKGYGASGVPQN